MGTNTATFPARFTAAERISAGSPDRNTSHRKWRMVRPGTRFIRADSSPQ